MTADPLPHYTNIILVLTEFNALGYNCDPLVDQELQEAVDNSRYDYLDDALTFNQFKTAFCDLIETGLFLEAVQSQT